MSDNITITEYEEDIKVAQLLLRPQKVLDHEDFSQPLRDEELVVTFEEEPIQYDPDDQVDFEVLEVGDQIGDVTEFSEEDDSLMGPEDQEAMGFQEPGRGGLPGATDYVDDPDEELEEEKEETPGNWEKDRDPRAFMAYILAAYPSGIPKHDGKSISKSEKVVQYLAKLNNEISEALRADKDDCLDIDTLERMRVNMIRDSAIMKRHIKKLQRKHRESIAGAEQEEGLIKEATTPKVQLVMTPFERAITGIILNATISAGKPFEEVYEFLNKKYSFTDREHLSIMQLAMDMGQPIFKDRGTINVNHSQNDESKQGVDFIKNYFA